MLTISNVDLGSDGIYSGDNSLNVDKITLLGTERNLDTESVMTPRDVSILAGTIVQTTPSQRGGINHL